MDILIQKYDPAYWSAIRRIHDEARKIELKLASLEEAFLPLEIAAEQEGLFDYNHVDVALQDHQVAGFCAYSDEELAWLYVSPDKMRQGIGRRLVANALSTETNLHSVEVLVGNEPAIKIILSER